MSTRKEIKDYRKKKWKKIENFKECGCKILKEVKSFYIKEKFVDGCQTIHAT